MEEIVVSYKIPSYMVEKRDLIAFIVNLIHNSEMRQDMESIVVSNNCFQMTFTNGQSYSVTFDREIV